MTGTLLKNTFRDIKNTKARFFSIMAIIALGVGFFSGIKATAPSMLQMAEDYYADTNLMDFRLVSSVGFDETDIKAVADTKGVTDVMPSYYADVLINFGDSGSAVRLISVPKAYQDNQKLNELTLLEGRMPEKSGEILVEKGNFGGKSLLVGDKVQIEQEAGELHAQDMLYTLEYTVVGIVQSPLYISYERGITTIGDGKISAYMYVLPQDFKVEKYTELYVKTVYSDSSFSPFSAEYKNGISKIASALEKTADTRTEAFQTEVIGEAQKEIDDGWSAYRKEKEEAETKLAASKEELENAQAEYDDKIAQAQAQMEQAQEQIESGETQLNQSIETYQTQIESGAAELFDSEKKLETAKQAYQDAKKKFETGITEAQSQIDSGKEQYNQAYDVYHNQVKPYMLYNRTQAQNELNQARASAAELERKLEELQTASPDEAGAIEALQVQLQILYAAQEKLQETVDSIDYALYLGSYSLDSTYEQIVLSQEQLNAEKTAGTLKLQEAFSEILAGEQQLAEGKAQLESAKTQGAGQLREAQKKLEDSKLALKEAKESFEQQKTEGQNQIDEGWKDYGEGKSTAAKKFSEAERELTDAQQELDQAAEAQWYVFDRDDNPGYANFTYNTDRVDAVASVFPTFFLLVAVLVCLTTMTRLIEEKRTEIGTLKALGYSGKSIVCKFLIYSSIAGVSGSLIGIAAGVSTLPFIIYNAYKMLYSMAEIPLVIDWVSVISGFIAAILCTVSVSAFTCWKTLKHKPASLMRPKAPKPGKRILLERIAPVWNRLGFTSKVTARNLFRYKTRLFMTVLGVAGCTALIVAAFGLLNSFSPLTDKQFSSIFCYDAAIVPKESGTEQSLTPLLSEIDGDLRIEDRLLANQTLITAENDAAVLDENTYLVVPENLEDFSALYSLHTRIGEKPLALNADGVVITEKMASEMQLSPGDTFTVLYDEKEARVCVTGICENYIYNYIYMTPEQFASAFEKEPSYNTVLVKSADPSESEETLGEDYLARNDVTAVSFTSTGVEEFDNMLTSLNMIVFVMIICAGVLAFIVLYNLTNINMEERVREIATIKVLGFYNRETAQYIYRENIVLTLLGILAGLLIGVFFTGFIVQTIEINNIMFGREIFFTTYLYAAGLTALFSVTVNVFMYFKMKKIDMVESLKSIE